MHRLFTQGFPQRVWEYAYDIKERLKGYPKLHSLFRKIHGYDLDLKHPQTHNQRIVHKMISDRNPLLTITSDKVKVRDHIRKKLGAEVAERILIPQFFVSQTGTDIPCQDWDFEFFLKANHASGFNKLILPGTDPEEVRSLAKYWLSQSFGQVHHEWAYRDIPRRIICEKVIRNEQGIIPEDIKLYCFNGRVKMVLMLKDRFGDQARIFTDENLVEIPGAQMYGAKKLYPIPTVSQFAEMKRISEILASDFVYCRVDFYSVGERIYFGELTHYTGGGRERFDDFSTDFVLGELWKPENRELNFFELYEQTKTQSAKFRVENPV